MCVDTYIYIHIHVCIYIYTHTHMCVYIYIHTHICVCTYTHTCVCVCVCVCVCMQEVSGGETHSKSPSQGLWGSVSQEPAIQFNWNEGRGPDQSVQSLVSQGKNALDLKCSGQPLGFPGGLDGEAIKPLQSCPTVWDPVDYSLTGSSVHGILQARVLEWIAMPSSRGFSQPRDQTCIS